MGNIGGGRGLGAAGVRVVDGDELQPGVLEVENPGQRVVVQFVVSAGVGEMLRPGYAAVATPSRPATSPQTSAG